MDAAQAEVAGRVGQGKHRPTWALLQAPMFGTQPLTGQTSDPSSLAPSLTHTSREVGHCRACSRVPILSRLRFKNEQVFERVMATRVGCSAAAGTNLPRYPTQALYLVDAVPLSHRFG